MEQPNERQLRIHHAISDEEKRTHIEAQMTEVLSKLHERGIENIEAFVVCIKWKEEPAKNLFYAGAQDELIELTGMAQFKLLFGE